MSRPSAPATRRQAEKNQRRQDLLDAAGVLFGARGYDAVSLDDVGSEVGVTGQAIYRHFKGKQDLLGQLLLGVSERLLAGAQDIRASVPEVAARSRPLIEFQVDFALGNPEVIRVQDQDLARLAEADRRLVRRMQREYLDHWSAALAALHPQDSRDELHTRVHGVIGLINSTSHSLKSRYGPGVDPRRRADSQRALIEMAQAAVSARLSP